MKVTHTAIGAEVRRGPYDIVLDGKRIGSVEMNDTFSREIEPGHHTLQVRKGRNSSRTKHLNAAQGEIVAFRCSGKGNVPIPGIGAIALLWSFVSPGRALSLHLEHGRHGADRDAPPPERR
ncbi:MAG: hypothetical protein M0004_13550 [Actinomycetota bacterium]|nr:hypothetical protein [Actinomycetota bacterium]